MQAHELWRICTPAHCSSRWGKSKGKPSKPWQQHSHKAIGWKPYAGASRSDEVGLDQLPQGRSSFASLASLLKRCGRNKALAEGKLLHAHIIEYGYDDSTFLGNWLVKMYGECGSMDDARAVFDKLANPNLYSWTILVSAYAKNSFFRKALDCFKEMQVKGLKPDAVAFLSAIDACAGMGDLKEGFEIHGGVVERGLKGQVVVGTALVNMYGKCGSLENARRVFNQIPSRDVVSWNAMITACAQNGSAKEALDYFYEMQLNGIRPDRASFVGVLDACGSLASLEQGRKVHASIVESGCEADIVVGTALIAMYSNCGSLLDAATVFGSMLRRDVITWNAMILAYTQHGHHKEALGYFEQLQLNGMRATISTFFYALEACGSLADLKRGQELHAAVVECGFNTHVVMANSLVDMYGKCGSLQNARTVFNQVPERNAATWNAIIVACAQNGNEKEALDYFLEMQHDGVKPATSTFVCALSACSRLKTLHKGQEIHAAILEQGCEGQLVVETALINMYGKCGSLQDARSVFNQMPSRNVISWTSMISAHSQNGCGKQAIHNFQQMQFDGLKPDSVAFVCVVDACASIADLEKGQGIHAAILESGYGEEVAVGNGLVNMYGKCGSLEDAKSVFEKMPQRDTVSWNVIIAACTQNEHWNEALDFFHQMQLHDIKPDPVTFVCALNACANITALEKGQEIHAAVLDRGWQRQIFVGTALIDMYGKCGALQDARNVFRCIPENNTASWTAIIRACAQNGHGEEALNWFFQMQDAGIRPDAVTFVCVLGVCADLGSLERGRDIHGSIMVNANSLESQVFVDNALISMYGKCNSVRDAQTVFDQMSQRDVVSWNAIISACFQTKHADMALCYFQQMLFAGVKPDHVTFVCALNACAILAALEKGKEIHVAIVNSRCEEQTVMVALVNMYAKCGSMDDARSVFCQMRRQNIVSWNTMITACAENGKDNEALDYFRQMNYEGIKPNELTFLSILSACSHTGRADDGRFYFLSMTKDYGLTPKMEHKLCLIDILGRAGQLDETENVFNQYAFESNGCSYTLFMPAEVM